MFSSIFSGDGDGSGGVRRHLPSSSGLMRSTLRDTIRHLRQIRVKAGIVDDDAKLLKKSGDPFRDKSNQFVYEVKQIKDLIRERNEGLRKIDQSADFTSISQNNDIRKRVRDVGQILNDIKVMVDDAELLLGKETKKKSPKREKVILLERQHKERQVQYQDCSEMLELVKRMSAEPVKGRNAPTSGGGSRTAALSRKTSEVSKKALLLEQLNLKVLRNRQSDLTAEGGGVEMAPVGERARLEDDPDTAEHMKILSRQDDEINRGLDRMRSNIGRLHEIALEIGAQLDRQNEMLEKTEENVDKRNVELKGINRRLTKLLKEQAPMNTFIMVACCVIILGMIGFLVFQFNVV